MLGRLIVLLSLGLIWSLPAYCHHASAANYKMNETIFVEGVVKKFSMMNPHVRLYFVVTTKTGETQEWLAEGNSVGVLMRAGWKESELKTGDFVKIKGRPARDGSHLVLWTTITKADGHILYGGNAIPAFSEGVPPEEANQIENLRRRQIQEREKAQSKGTTQP